jgi:hypothetical protein
MTRTYTGIRCGKLETVLKDEFERVGHPPLRG